MKIRIYTYCINNSKELYSFAFLRLLIIVTPTVTIRIKYFIFVLCCFCAGTAPHICAQQPFVTENFSDNRHGWMLFKDSVAEARFYDNTLALRNFHPSSFASATRPVALNVEKDFSVTVVIRAPKDTANGRFGLYWGGKNNFNFNAVWIGYGDSVIVERIEQGMRKTLARSKNILPKEMAGQWLTLTIAQKSRQLHVSVNNTEWCVLTTPSFFGQLLGVAAIGKVTAQIDSLAVFQERPPINLLPNLQKTVLKEHLDNAVNSPFVEKIPVISANGKTLWFTRSNHPKNIGFDRSDDIWFSNLNPDGHWETAKNPGAPLNNEYFNSVVSVTPDNNTLLLFGTYEDIRNVRAVPQYSGKTLRADTTLPKRYVPTLRTGFFTSHRKLNSWSPPEPVIIRDFYCNGDYLSACMSSDQKVLLISMEREDSYGYNDIYACFAMPDSTWSAPLNIGPDVNSYDNESFPYLTPDGLTMYFTTAGRSGFGDQDIFVTRRIDSTWQHWTEPMNFGPAINTPITEASYTTTASGDYSYFVSKDDVYGTLDIFRLVLPDSAKPKPLALVTGKTLNSKTGEPVEADISYERVSDGKEVGRARSNPADGSYVIALPAGERYGFHAEAEGFLCISDYLNLDKLSQYIEATRDLILVPIEKGAVIRLNNIFFVFGKWDLKPSSFSELNRIATFLKKYPEISIEISGHTDNIGSLERNLEVSSNRAKSVADYLVKHGINSNRIIAKGYGYSRPVTGNTTELERQQNRRVEFFIR